jgi:hypothetical protein
MEKLTFPNRQLYIVIGAIIGWLTIAAQFYLIICNRATTVIETIFRFFVFFTILTNILVAICYTSLWSRSAAGFNRFFSRPSTLTATTVYITVVGVVYNLLLRSLWKPEGLQLIVDELLHTVLPLLFIVFWWLFVPKDSLKWKNAFFWMIYPLVYILYVLIFGALTRFYPYPFTDVNKLGYARTLLNGAALVVIFLLLSLLLVAVAKKRGRLM